jgi:uncharacterized protein (DUF58 family)
MKTSCTAYVSFADASSKLVFFDNFDPRSWQALTLSKGLDARSSVETVQAQRIVELESMEAAQAKRTVELEEACAKLKLEKENVTARYRRWQTNIKNLKKKANVVECEKADAAEAHAAQLANVEEKLVKETQDYKDYRWDVRHSRHELHEVLKALLREFGVRCLPFPIKSAPVDDYISWFEEVVKVVSGVV